MEMEWIPERSNELVSNVMDDGTVIVSLDDGRLNVVNEVGSFVWDSIDGQKSLESIVQKVHAHFEVSAEQAQSDVLIFMRELTDRQLVSWKPN